MRLKFGIFFLALGLAFASTATAEEYNYNNQNGYYDNGQPRYAPAQNYDGQYYIPPTYQGRSYPDEYQGVFGYHDTNRTSQIDDNDAYYLYYYY